MPPGGPLTAALREEIARHFAPQLRFNAWHNDGNPSPQNRSEDFFPMGVAAFFAELESGMVRVTLPPGSVNSTVSTNTPVATSQPPEMTDDKILHQPRNMAGDAPGDAPLYTHVVQHPQSPTLQPDGSGELLVTIEYFVFYPQDRSEAQLLTFIPTPGPLDFSGHRGDWEHTAYLVRVQLDPGLSFQGGSFEGAWYSAHTYSFEVDAADLEFVDDAGLPDPAGNHPLVFVSQGKHASYPQAGEWADHGEFPSWLAAHTDFFRGNGVVLDSWQGPLFDLEETSAQAAEFASADFLQLIARSNSSAIQQLADWTAYDGDWGSDDISISLPFLPSITISSSPGGPKTKSAYGGYASGSVSTRSWTDAKQNEAGLKVYSELGITIPPASPVPLPIRQ